MCIIRKRRRTSAGMRRRVRLQEAAELSGIPQWHIMLMIRYGKLAFEVINECIWLDPEGVAKLAREGCPE
jgi:hypothetical protein